MKIKMGRKTFQPITVVLMSQSTKNILRARLRVAQISAKNRRTGDIHASRVTGRTRDSREALKMSFLYVSRRTTGRLAVYFCVDENFIIFSVQTNKLKDLVSNIKFSYTLLVCNAFSDRRLSGDSTG